MAERRCVIRETEISDTPEERVRQGIIVEMINSLGYPRESFVVEKKLSELPHMQGVDVPNRRIDLAVYHPVGDTLTPLLLIECKASHIDTQSFHQVIGYNHYIGAPFISLCGSNAVLTGWLDQKSKKWRLIPRLLLYQELV